MALTDTTTVEDQLVELIQDEFLDSDDQITLETPLLEWGILKSIETARLVSFIKDQFGVQVPAASVSADNLATVRTIASMVRQLHGDQPAA